MEIKKICVLGAGLMGAGIAQVVAEAGYDAALRDIEERFVQGAGSTRFRRITKEQSARGK